MTHYVVTMDGSLLQVVLAVFTAMLLQTWYLQREIRRSREESMRHTDRSLDQLRDDLAEHKTDTKDSFDQLRTGFEKSHDQLRDDLAEHKTDTKDSFDQLRTGFEKSHDQLRADFAEHKTDTKDSFDQLRTGFEKSHDQLRADFAEHKDITERNHRETQRQLTNLGEGLGDARERLARIEGYLRIGLPEPPQAAAGG